jgi:pimeloyl-ACP methyl ester carboxylesterase
MNTFSFPVLQLQADRDPARPLALFADAATACPNVRLKWVTDANHFDNLDQPQQMATAIDDFLHTIRFK